MYKNGAERRCYMQQSAMTLTKGPSPLLQPTIRPFLSTLQNCCFCSLACLPLGNSQGQCRLLFTTVSPGLSFKQYLTQVGCSMNASLINARPDTELPLGLSLFCTWKAFLTLLFEHVQVNHTFFFFESSAPSYHSLYKAFPVSRNE